MPTSPSKPATVIEEPARARVAQVLEEELAQVQTPEDAEAIVRRMERLAAGTTEAEKTEEASDSPLPAAGEVERTKERTPAGRAETAAVLVETASQALAPKPDAPAVAEAAQEALGSKPVPVPRRTHRGRSLLRAAVLHRMGPLQALDARLFLAVNSLPRHPWGDRFMAGVALITTGGWVWIIGVYLAHRLHVRRGRRGLKELVPSLVAATWIVEHPIKKYFHRRRPFIDIVRAVVVGVRPGSWSFPSGHSAASFAGAWVLSRVWPDGTPVFYGLASLVGFNRVYMGAHYPGDVASGAMLGTVLAALFRRFVRGLT